MNDSNVPEQPQPAPTETAVSPAPEPTPTPEPIKSLGSLITPFLNQERKEINDKPSVPTLPNMMPESEAGLKPRPEDSIIPIHPPENLNPESLIPNPEPTAKLQEAGASIISPLLPETPESQPTPTAAPQFGPADFESPFAGAMFSAVTQPIPEPLPTAIPEPVPASPLGTPVSEVPSPSIEPVSQAKPGLLGRLIGRFRPK